MMFKQPFVLSMAILLLSAAAACGGSASHEAQVEAAESEEIVAAPSEFTEPPAATPTEEATPGATQSAAQPTTRRGAVNAVAPARSEPPPITTPPSQPASANPTPDAPVSSPAPRDAENVGQIVDSRGDSVVVPPSAPRREVSTPAFREQTPPPAPDPRYVTIPEGTAVEIRLEERVASNVQKAGDRFEGRLDRDIEVDGEVIFPVGTEVIGKVLEAEESGRVEGRARMQLAVETLKRGDETFSIRTDPITFEAEGSKGRDAKIIGGAAAVGALIGAITGGKKGAAVGAASGAGAGTAGVLITKGEEVELAKERLLSFRLEDPFEVQVK